MIHNFSAAVHGICYTSAGIAALSMAVSDSQVLTWGAVGIAVGSALVTAVLSGYHKIREAARTEDQADRKSVLQDVRDLANAQTDVEVRVRAMEEKAGELAKLLSLRKSELDQMIVAIKVEVDTLAAQLIQRIEAIRCQASTATTPLTDSRENTGD